MSEVNDSKSNSAFKNDARPKIICACHMRELHESEFCWGFDCDDHPILGQRVRKLTKPPLVVVCRFAAEMSGSRIRSDLLFGLYGGAKPNGVRLSNNGRIVNRREKLKQEEIYKRLEEALKTANEEKLIVTRRGDGLKAILTIKEIPLDVANDLINLGFEDERCAAYETLPEAQREKQEDT